MSRNVTPKPTPAVQPPPPSPWFPNEAPVLDAAASIVRRSIREIDGLLVDLAQAVAGVWWQGPDADGFRRRWNAEAESLRQLRVRLLQISASMGQVSMNEESRFRAQERQR
jgi:hypothetical protein